MNFMGRCLLELFALPASLFRVDRASQLSETPKRFHRPGCTRKIRAAPRTPFRHRRGSMENSSHAPTPSPSEPVRSQEFVENRPVLPESDNRPPVTVSTFLANLRENLVASPG